MSVRVGCWSGRIDDAQVPAGRQLDTLVSQTRPERAINCTLTARRLKPGAYEALSAARDSDAPEVIGRWRPSYHVRDASDPDVAIWCGFLNGSLEELAEVQTRAGRDGQVAPHRRNGR